MLTTGVSVGIGASEDPNGETDHLSDRRAAGIFGGAPRSRRDPRCQVRPERRVVAPILRDGAEQDALGRPRQDCRRGDRRSRLCIEDESCAVLDVKHVIGRQRDRTFSGPDRYERVRRFMGDRIFRIAVASESSRAFVVIAVTTAKVRRTRIATIMRASSRTVSGKDRVRRWSSRMAHEPAGAGPRSDR